MQNIFNAPQGDFSLHRLPYRKQELLRAWDAADEYLLHYVDKNITTVPVNTLILNDNFGALAVALHHLSPVAISDSWLSHQASKENLSRNHLPDNSIIFSDALNWPSTIFDLILIRIPKTLALLEHQLIYLQTRITPESNIIAAGMVKSMPANAWKLIEKYIGPSRPSLAKKKARLIFVDPQLNKTELKNPYPVYYTLENTDYRICNHANVFSRDSLDIGTRFLLQHLPTYQHACKIVDLGCGNGIVGLILAEQHPDATINFIDESYMAIASARENFQSAFPSRKADFKVTDGLTEFKDQSIDLIICNPPFHQQSTVGNQIAISLFKHSFRVLKPGGELWVIGNRHLAYHRDIQRLFNHCHTIASNEKFVIRQARK